MELPDLIDSLAARPGPVLTWYGQSRAELGGGVAARWLAKTANLLAGDLAGDLFGDDGESVGTGVGGPGSGEGGPAGPAPTGTIRVGLGSSWQSVTWLAAAWLSGWRSVGTGLAHIDEGDAAYADGERATGTASADASGWDASGVNVWVSDRIGPAHLAAVEEGCWVLAQATTPLALSWPGELPEGVLDALQELSAQADALEITPDVSPDLVIAEGHLPDATPTLLRAGDLGREEHRSGADATAWGPGRVLVTSRAPVDDARTVLSHWAAGRSVVIVDPALHDEDATRRIAETERAMIA